MIKKWLTVCGIALFCIGAVIGAYLLWHGIFALLRSKVNISLAGSSECNLDNVHVSKSVTSDKETIAITAIFKGVQNHVDQTILDSCESEVSLVAPDFEISPALTQTVNLAQNQAEGSIVWLASPRKLGSYTILVSTKYANLTRGIEVTNLFGFTALQAQILSYATTFLGPILSAPWWLEKWKTRKVKKPKTKISKSTTN